MTRKWCGGANSAPETQQWTLFDSDVVESHVSLRHLTLSSVPIPLPAGTGPEEVPRTEGTPDESYNYTIRITKGNPSYPDFDLRTGKKRVVRVTCRTFQSIVCCGTYLKKRHSEKRQKGGKHETTREERGKQTG